jgi:hypothetical protein
VTSAVPNANSAIDQHIRGNKTGWYMDTMSTTWESNSLLAILPDNHSTPFDRLGKKGPSVPGSPSLSAASFPVTTLDHRRKNFSCQQTLCERESYAQRTAGTGSRILFMAILDCHRLTSTLTDTPKEAPPCPHM